MAERSTVQKLEVPFDAEASDAKLLRDVARYYHEQLLESPEALEYLEKRGLRDDALINRFQLGFSNRTLGYRLPGKNRKTGEVLRSRLEGLGIYRASGHEHLNGSIVFPILDEQGSVVEMYGRKITSSLRKGAPPENLWARFSRLRSAPSPRDVTHGWAERCSTRQGS